MRLSWRILSKSQINQDLLLVPVVVSQVNNDWDQHWEGLVLVGLQNVEEIVIFKEAHSSVSHLQVNATNAPHDSLEESLNQVLNLVYFTDFKDFLQLSQEESFLDAVGEWPVSKESLKKWDGQCSVLGEEQHRASKELLVELGASLDLVKGNNHILEEYDMLISQRNSKSTNDASKNIEKFCSSVEFMTLMNEGIEALIDSLSNHLSSWHKLHNQYFLSEMTYLSVKLVKNVLQIVSLNRLFRIKELKELLNKLWGYVHLKGLDINGFINN